MTKARDLANASTALSAVDATELAFVDGVTSAIQTQIDTKAPSSTAVTLTGTQTLTNKTLTNPVIASVINNTLTSTTGDIIYASAANTPARLGIGSSAQVLTVASGVPSWATPASSAMTLIQRTSFSNVANTSTSFDSVFSTTYAVYSIVIENCSAATAGDNLQFQFRYAGPTTQATTNIWSNYTTTVYSGAQAMTFGNNTTVLELSQETGTSADPFQGQYWLQNYKTSDRQSFFGSGICANAVTGTEFYGHQYTARTYTGFIMSSGSSNITGTVSIYGLAKS
jgi:hypothetical protein